MGTGLEGRRGDVVINRVEEILDEPFEQIVQRVCAIDVAKDSGKVCVRTPAETGSGRRVSKVWDVPARTNAIIELGDHLACQSIEKVTLESTSDYWRIWFYLLEDRGLDVQLVNARDVKNVPGRPKTDKLDSVWLAKLTEKGLLLPSFVPPRQIRGLRDYTRLRVDLTAERVRHWQRLEKLLEDSLIKITSVASRIDLISVREMIEALIAGQRNPRVLAGMARGRMRLKHADLVEALTGQFDDHHAELARILLDQIDALTVQIDTLTARIDELLAQVPTPPPRPEPDPDDHGPGPTRRTEHAHKGPSSPAGSAQIAGAGPGPVTALGMVDILDQIPGIGRHNAQEIIAESGRTAALLRAVPPQNRACDSSPHTAQASREGVAGAVGILRWRAWSSRRQEACIRRIRFPSGGPCSSWWTRFSAAICLRTTLVDQRSHSRGDWGGRSVGSKWSRHSGQRPACLVSRRWLLLSNGGLTRRRRAVQ
jgi:transposase